MPYAGSRESRPPETRTVGKTILVSLVCLFLAFGGVAKAVELANIDADVSGPPLVIAQGTADFSINAKSNSGDYHIQIGSSYVGDAAEGVLIGSVRENGRGTVFATSSIARHNDNDYFIPIHQAGSGVETDTHVAAIYLPFAEGWTAGVAYNPAGGGAVNELVASAGLTLGTHFIDHNNGQFEVYLPGVNSRADGILLVNGAQNEGNYALSAPSADGTYFRVGVHDNAANGAAYEQDPVAFAYLPFGTPNVTMGRIVGNGAAVLSQGEFSIVNPSSGVYRLSIPGQDPTTGVLLISAEGFEANNCDNIVTYQAVGTEWEIQTRDLPANPPALQGMPAAEPVFNFAFIPLASPPTGPVARPMSTAGQVAAANFNVTEITPGNGANEMYAQVSNGSGGLGVRVNNLGDIDLARFSSVMSSSDGVLLATVTEHFRDNSATGGISDYGLVDTWARTGGEYVVSTHRAAPGSAEHNIDFAVAFFPNTSGFDTGQKVATSGGTATVTIAGAGDTSRSGVLMVTAEGNKNNFANAQPLGDGSGWTVQVRDANSNLEAGEFNYAFLPYGTENLIAGQVTQTGCLLNKSGQFSLLREGAGLYRLTIPGESPESGMLLLTGTQASWSSDNFVVYKPDGNDFLIQGVDAQSDGTHAAQDTDFNFAFIGFDTPPTNPQLRSIDPNAIAAANIRVVENDTGDTATSVSVSTPESTPGFTIHNANRGDYYPSVDGQHLLESQGVLLASVRQNGRANNHPNTETHYPIAVTTADGGEYRVSTFWSTVPSWPDEFNVDVAAAYLPYGAGWSGGRAWNDENNGEMTHFVGSSDIALGVNLIDVASPAATYHLSLTKNGGADGVDARRDGLVFANGGKDENNFGATGPSSDGSHFVIETHDDYGGGLENDPITFAYIPYDTENVVMGRVAGYGGLYNRSGAFTLRRESTGTYRLSIPGQSPTTGVLLLTPDATSSAEDNIVSYQADGDDFIIEQREIDTGVVPFFSEVGNAPAFNFAFIPFDTPPTAPGVRNHDPTAQVAAANIRVIEIGSGDTGDNLHAEVTEGSGYLTTPTWGRGDVAIYQNGVPLDPTAGVMLATIREHVRDNSGTGGSNDYGVIDPYITAGGYSVSTCTASATVNAEHNIDFAVAYFPDALGFATGGSIAAPGGSATVILPNSGDSRTSGVLMVSAYGDDDNFATVQPQSTGNGWTVHVYDNGSGVEADSFNYAFLPYGTENLVAGQVAQTGYLINKSGQFSLHKEGTGLYRLSIPGESPESGMLLLNATQASYSSDNIVVYKADGNDFLIQGVDMQSNNTHAPQDTDFNFAFISFDTPPMNPQLRTIDARSAAAGIFEVFADASGSLLGAVGTQTTSGLTCSSADTGDFWLSLDGQPITPRQGIILATVRENGRSYDGASMFYGLPSVTAVKSNTLDTAARITIIASGAANTELNMNFAAAMFPFDAHWSGAHVDGTTGSLLASGGVIQQSMVSRTAAGRYQVVIPGIDSRVDGALFAINGSNLLGDNSFTSAVLNDGSGWLLGSYDNSYNLGTFQDENFSFLYVPFKPLNGLAVDGLVGGRVDDDGSVLASVGEFTLTRQGTGEYLLSILGETPETGMLLLTCSKYASPYPEDNYLSYESLGDDFLIQSRDLPGTTLEDTEFVFAFLKFDAELMMIPEPTGLMLLALGAMTCVLFRWRR